MPTVSEVTSAFVVAMKRAKKVVADTKWCCIVHELKANTQITVFSTLKNASYREFKAGLITEAAFVEFISIGTQIVTEYTDGLERGLTTVDDDLGINMPMPTGAA